MSLFAVSSYFRNHLSNMHYTAKLWRLILRISKYTGMYHLIRKINTSKYVTEALNIESIFKFTNF